MICSFCGSSFLFLNMSYNMPPPSLAHLSVLPLGPVSLYGLLLECLYIRSMGGHTAHCWMLSMCLQLTLMKFIAAREKVQHRIMHFQFTASMMQSHAVLTTESLCCMIIIIYNIISPLPHLLFVLL
jgi:hypothetical protein